jgi:hypothetical protein
MMKLRHAGRWQSALARGAMIATAGAGLATTAHAQADCIFAEPQTVRLAAQKDPNNVSEVGIRFSDLRLTAHPLYTVSVPAVPSPNDACRIQVSPAEGQARFGLSFSITRPKDNNAGLEGAAVRIRAGNPAEFVVSQFTDERTSAAGRVSMRIEMKPTDANSPAAAHRVVVTVVPRGAVDTASFDLVIVWTPPVAASLRSVPAACDRPVCLVRKSTTFVQIVPSVPGELVTTGDVKYVFNTSPDSLVATLERRGGDTLGFTVTNPNDSASRMSVRLKLITPRHVMDAAGAAPVTSIVASAPVLTFAPKAVGVEFFADPAKQRRVTQLRMNSQPQRVFVETTAALDEEKDYRIFDESQPDTTKPVATLRLASQGGNAGASRIGTLTPAAPTTYFPNQPALVRLAPYVGSKTPVQVTQFHLDVRPRVSISNVQTQEPSGAWRDGIHLRPLSPNNRIRLVGTDVASLSSPHLPGAVSFTRDQGILSPDTAAYTIATDTTLKPAARLRFVAPDGNELTRDIALVHASDATPHLRFLTVEYDGGPATPLDTMPPGALLGIKVMPTVRFRAVPEAIERTRAQLFGVQYVQVQMVLRDDDGDLKEQKQIPCIAVVPPPVNGIAYVVDPACPSLGNLASGLLLVDSLAQRAAINTLWALEVIVRHISSRHGGQLGDEARFTFRQRRRITIDIKTQLPTGLISFQPGKSPDAVVSYAATQVGATYPVFAKFRFGSHIGVALPNSPQGNLSSAELSPILSTNLALRNRAQQTVEFFFAVTRPFSGRWCRGSRRCNEPYRFLIGPAFSLRQPLKGE